MIPFFCYCLLKEKNLLAGVVIILSGITDFLDGFIARKFNMVTELGKVIDPIADKLTQIVLAVCLAIFFRPTAILFIVVLLKEIFQGSFCLYLLKKQKKLDGAMWFGKVSTAIFYVCTILLIYFLDSSYTIKIILVVLPTIFILLSSYKYTRLFKKMKNEE
ncbi:MAG: CDP-alcohol phosphatidyltransferase family protein [Oscillospiraceae bacterium]